MRAGSRFGFRVKVEYEHEHGREYPRNTSMSKGGNIPPLQIADPVVVGAGFIPSQGGRVEGGAGGGSRT